MSVMQHAQKPVVWHLSADFPDPFEPHKTTVIRDLLGITDKRLQHFVVSLNRISPSLVDTGLLALGTDPAQIIDAFKDFERGIAIRYRAPARGVLHETMLRKLAAALAIRLANHAKPDLIIGHKLTVEGIIAERLAEHFGVPYALSIQGDTDTKILGARRDLTQTYRRIYHGAQIVFPFTPWAQNWIESKLGERAGSTILLPCSTDLDDPREALCPGENFVTAFHLKNHARKNLSALVKAMEIAQQARLHCKLEVIGGGSAQDEAACRRIANRSAAVTFMGNLERQAMRKRLGSAIGFVLPSLRESFGLVFIEALFAGLPIIYPRDQALDGYMDGLSFAIPVDARSPQEIASAMQYIQKNERSLKADLRRWQHSNNAAQFRRPAIADRFCRSISK